MESRRSVEAAPDLLTLSEVEGRTMVVLRRLRLSERLAAMEARLEIDLLVERPFLVGTGLRTAGDGDVLDARIAGDGVLDDVDAETGPVGYRQVAVDRARHRVRHLVASR